MKHLLFIFYFLFFTYFFGCRAPVEIQQPHEEPAPTEKEDVAEIFEAKSDWVNETLARLTLEEKIGQMIMPRATGYFVNSESDEYQKMIHLAKDRKVGGFCFFQSDVYTTAFTINKLQGLSGIPLLISADFERGGPMRIRRMTPFPEAMAIGAANRTDLAFKMGKIVAAECRAIGVHQNFAPVADVNNNPFNPVINIRSYGESPKLVAEIAAAYAQGLQAGGVIATAKHFPGHGDTDIDSHYDLPKLSVSQSRLDSVELYPFRYLIGKGVMSVMTAHLEVPALEKEKRLPASISRSITTNLLKDEFCFDGLIVTDALEMKGITKIFNIDEVAVRAVASGADVLLLPPDEDAAIDAIFSAVVKGRLTVSRIDSSVRKILALKQWLKLDENRFIDINKIPDAVSTPDSWRTAKEIAQASITVVKNDGVIPIRPRKKVMSIIISDSDDYRTDINRPGSANPNERAGDYFISELRSRLSRLTVARLSPRSNKLDFESTLAQARESDIALVALYVRTRTKANPFGLQQNLIDFINSVTNGLSEPKKGNNIVVSFGNPYAVGAVKNPSALICAYSDGELSAEAAAEVLFGEVEAQGKLPVTIPSVYPFGTGIRVAKSTLHEEKTLETILENKFKKVDGIVERAIRDSAFPGAQLVVVQKGEILLNNNYGKLDYTPGSPEVTDSTLYDIASLTKAVATTSAIMKLYDEGKINLDEKVAAYLPAFGANGKENIIVRNLLLHNSGLPAWQKFYLTCKTYSEVLDSIYNSKLIYKTGDSTVYSDFGFIVLGKIIESITGLSLDTYLQIELFEPLGLMSTFYNPPVEVIQRTAPTELDTVWRKKLIRGTVHDETSDLLGGVAGHAGLFSTASDLAVFVQMILNGGSYGGVEYIKPETIKLFTERKNISQQRGLGWDFKSMNGYTSAGSLFGTKSFGHTGFTGTSIWIDPERNLFVIFLTNRVHPTRSNTKISKVRPALHDTIIEAIR